MVSLVLAAGAEQAKLPAEAGVPRRGAQGTGPPGARRFSVVPLRPSRLDRPNSFSLSFVFQWRALPRDELTAAKGV